MKLFKMVCNRKNIYYKSCGVSFTNIPATDFQKLIKENKLSLIEFTSDFNGRLSVYTYGKSLL